MVHYTCDLCGRTVDPRDEIRYVVHMEVYAATEASGVEEEQDDRDHLEELQEMLEQMDSGDFDAITEDVYRELRFDLCSECRRKFLENPLRRELVKQFNFSEN